MATVDSSIALGIKPFDPLEGYGRAVQLNSLLGQQRVQDMALAKAEQDRDQERTLADLYRGSVGPGGQIDRNALLTGAATRGLGARIPGLQKQFAEADKAGVDVQNTRSQISERDVKTEIDKSTFVTDLVSRLASNPNVTHDDVIRELQSAPPQFRDNAAQFARVLPGDQSQLKNFLLTVGLKAQERLQALTPKIDYRNTGKVQVPVDTNPLTNPTPQPLAMTTTPGEDQSAATARAGQAVTKRGQNMADAVAQGHLGLAREQANQGVTYQTDDQGNIIALPTKLAPGAPAPTGRIAVGPDGKPIVGKNNLTEMQGKATTFAARMRDASATLDAMEKRGISGSDLRTIAAGSGWTNWLASSEGQQYRQAQENWITANLRQESGAAIGRDEMTKDVRKFFPVPGDDPAVITQKQQARKVAEQGMLAQAGPGARQVTGMLDRASGGKDALPVPVKSDADYNALPKGTRFVAPDGRIGVKS